MIEMPTSDEHTEFCSRVKARRKELGLTQLDMAQRLGITQPQYQGIEAGVNEPKFRTQYRLAEALETTVHDLMPVGVRET